MNAPSTKYINPLTDFGFKKLFGSELNKALLIDFLNEILPNEHIIKDLSYSQTEHLGQSEVDRKAIFDLYCIDSSGERFIVELQKAKQNFFKDRSVYYSSFPIQEQAQRGGWNFKLEPVYTVGILDFVFEENKENKDVIHFVELKNQRNEVFYEKLKFIYIELPKFTKKESELETHFDKWLYVFRHLAELQNRPQKLQEKVFQKLFESAEIAKFSHVERKAYQESLKHYRDINNVVDTAKEEGIKKGIKKGKIEGRKEGRKEGIQVGLDRRNVENALAMKNEGISVEIIMKVTNLTKEQVEKL